MAAVCLSHFALWLALGLFCGVDSAPERVEGMKIRPDCFLHFFKFVLTDLVMVVAPANVFPQLEQFFGTASLAGSFLKL